MRYSSCCETSGVSGAISWRGSSFPRTRTAGCAPTATCRSDAFRATVCSSRSSIEYRLSAMAAALAIGSAIRRLAGLRADVDPAPQLHHFGGCARWVRAADRLGRPSAHLPICAHPQGGHCMTARLSHRLGQVRRDEGFTLIELLVVIIILGILLAIAIPSYLSFRTRANKSAAQANVRAAVPGMEAYNADHATGYTGATLTKLQGSYDAGIKNIKISVANSTTYCIVNTVPGTVFYHKSGPGADIKSGHC